MASILRSRTCSSAFLPISRSSIPKPKHQPFHPNISNSSLRPRPFSTKSHFLPPDPTGLPRYTPPRYPRLTAFAKKASRRLALAAALGTTFYLTDYYLNYSTFTRNLRTLWIAILISADYKLNFRPGAPADQLSAIHERTADRILTLCFENGGLYQKMGQAIAMQTAALPPVFQKKFRLFFDETPQAGFKDIARIVKEEYSSEMARELFGVETGRWDVEDLFVPGSFQRRAVGSASVAQVHKARLKSGEWVAVKVQKPGISRQVYWDLAVFKFVMDVFSERLFAMPVGFLTPFICERLSSETDFVNETKNSERMREFVASEKSLKDRVYIPKVFQKLSTKRVMIAEWIDGVAVADRDILTAPYRGDHNVGKPMKGRSSRDDPNPPVWGLDVSLRQVMHTMVDLFCAQIFLGGWVHCDPHPGNILIRRLPSGKPQLVLLDHGLYISTTPEFRHQYAQFWRSLLTFDNAVIQDIASAWGIGNSDLFASSVLLKPYSGGSNQTLDVLEGRSAPTAYERHQQMRALMEKFLAEEEKMPKELVFIARNMRIVQGNNAILGSPVNRIRIIGEWASYALTKMEGGTQSWYRHVLFRIVMVTLDIGFYVGRVKQYVLGGMGFEEGLEMQMRKVAKEEFGVDLQGDVFAG